MALLVVFTINDSNIMRQAGHEVLTMRESQLRHTSTCAARQLQQLHCDILH